KRELRQQAFHADELPSGCASEHVVQLGEFRNRLGRHAEFALVLEEFARGAAGKDVLLTFEQRGPGGMIRRGVAFPGLVDDCRGVHRDRAFVGLLVFYAARLSVHGGGPTATSADSTTAAVRARLSLINAAAGCRGYAGTR